MRNNSAIVVLCAALGGCASTSAEITPAYVSPVIYQGYTCQQLALEARAVSQGPRPCRACRTVSAQKINGRRRLRLWFSGPRHSLLEETSKPQPNWLR